MSTENSIQPLSKGSIWAGRILSTLAALFMVMDAGVKFTKIPAVTETFNQLGYPVELAPTLGIVIIVCLVLYVLPQTSVLGAILFTGYFGGAISTHLRVHNPLFSHVLFPVYIALFIWGGLYLREPRLRALIPFRNS